MAIGFTPGNGGGDFLPVLKYDARAGRTFRVDRADGASIPTEVQFKAVVDLENVEVGWMHFVAGAAPDMRLWPLGSTWGDQPSPAHKRGIRVLVKLSKDTGGDVREVANSSAAFLRAFDALHDSYLAGKAANPGKLPIVVITKTIPVVSKGNGQSSTNYEPVFAITGWVDRPQDLKASPRGGPAVQASHQPAATAPATGSTQVSAPAPQPARELVTADDFG